jgi:uncharacterized low-complexity protein
MKKITKTPLAAAMGVAFMSTFAVTAANAEANPFGMSELSQGYMQLAEADKPAEAKVVEKKCAGMMDGDKMKKGMEASCGEMMKGKEGSCGMMQSGDSMKGKEGEGAKTDATAKAPEASCGGMMEDGKMKKGMESACGAMMKGKEGSCGMMSSGDAMKSKEGSCGAAMKTPEDKATKSVNKPTGTKVVPYVPAAK